VFYDVLPFMFVALTQKVLNLESVIISKTEIIQKKSDVEAQLE
jgi:hypothetical protein